MSSRRPWLFPPSRASRLESRDREALLPWRLICSALRPGPGFSYADLGAGPGVFTRKLLEATRGQGRFTAVESQPAMFGILKTRLRAWTAEGLPGASRVEAHFAEGLPLPGRSVDRALLIHLLHELADPSAYLTELRRVLRPWGRALVVDWNAPGDSPWIGPSGPPAWCRISMGRARDGARRAGFRDIEPVSGFPHGWGLALTP